MDEVRNPMESEEKKDTAETVRLIEGRPRRKRTVYVHPEMAIHLAVNHSDAESIIRGFPENG
jgi:hypothetical protein